MSRLMSIEEAEAIISKTINEFPSNSIIDFPDKAQLGDTILFLEDVGNYHVDAYNMYPIIANIDKPTPESTLFIKFYDYKRDMNYVALGMIDLSWRMKAIHPDARTIYLERERANNPTPIAPYSLSPYILFKRI